MKKLPGNLKVALYLAPSRIDAVAFQKGLFSSQLFGFGQAEIAPPKEGASGDELIIDAIRTALNKIDPRLTKISTVVPVQELMIRHFKMPDLPAKELESTVRFEGKKYIPFRLDEVISDYHVLGPTKDKKNINVLFIAVKKDVILQQVALLKRAGLEVETIDALPLALAELFWLDNQFNIKKDEVIAVLNAGADSANLSVLKDRLPYLVLDIPLVGGKEDMLDKLASELRLSLNYYQRQFPGEVVNKIFITGERKFEGWVEHLKDSLKIDTQVVDPLKALKTKVKLPAQAVIAAGLARRISHPNKISINLLPQVTRAKTAQALNFNLILSAELVVALLICGFIYSQTSARIAGAKRKLRTAKNAIASYEKSTYTGQSQADLEKAKKKLNTVIQVYKNFNKNKISWSEKLTSALGLIPEGIWITDLSLGEEFSAASKAKPDFMRRRIIIEGSSFSRDKTYEIEIVKKFVDALNTDEEFTSGFDTIKLKSLDRSKGYSGVARAMEYTNFEIEIKSTDSKEK